MNERTTRIKLYTDRTTKLIVNNSSYTIDNKYIIKVNRQKDTLVLIASNDTLKKEIRLKPINSFYYYSNIITYGLGFIWDYKNPKRYTYQRNVYIDLNSISKRPERFLPSRKGQVDFIYSLPWINSFYLHPKYESTKINTGFWGVAIGLDYYHKRNRFISLTANAVSDFFIPVPGAVDISGEYELMSSIYLNLTDNLQFKRLTYGFGFNYSKNIWDHRYSKFGNPPPPSREPITKSSQSIGLTFNGYFRLGNHFNIGLIYRPSLFNVHPYEGFKYEHLISIDFGWKWKINK